MAQPNQILIIDDEDSISELLALLLSREGYATMAAASGEEALFHLKTFTPDLILLDLMMPHMSGLAFLNQYHQLPFHRAIIILISASGNLIELAQESSAYHALVKPFDINDLFATVKYYLPVDHTH